MTRRSMRVHHHRQLFWCVLSSKPAAYPINPKQDALLTPFRVLFSKTALRIYLNIFLFGLATVILLGVSSIAYGIFYYRFIPTVGVDREVYLQFGYANTSPSPPHPVTTMSSSTEPSTIAVATPGALPHLDLSLSIHNPTTSPSPSTYLVPPPISMPGTSWSTSPYTLASRAPCCPIPPAP